MQPSFLMEGPSLGPKLMVAAGDCWIGLSSANDEDISWDSFRAPDGKPGRDPLNQLQLAGNAFVENPGIYDLAFKIDGSVNAISALPEPATWAMFIVGFGAMGILLRANRGRSAVSPA